MWVFRSYVEDNSDGFCVEARREGESRRLRGMPRVGLNARTACGPDRSWQGYGAAE